ncbi:hypothetical protein scyTo_0006514 [Scyliorhinus torazame]|uniref:EGF-like domain-containing protein n=1 Tax=Scyliorhinus torazame TaxID=75743 RepID=A0A401PIC5_SCYTO|nr:hypothetical protein [Scyliorhinus torazame]
MNVKAEATTVTAQPPVSTAPALSNVCVRLDILEMGRIAQEKQTTLRKEQETRAEAWRTLNINECVDPVMNQCDTNAHCLNSDGSYRCECKPYYRGNGTHCEGCFCPPEIIPGTANLPALSGNPCPCVSGFIVSNNFPSLYQNSADMYWFFNMAQLSNSTRQYKGNGKPHSQK